MWAVLSPAFNLLKWRSSQGVEWCRLQRHLPIIFMIGMNFLCLLLSLFPFFLCSALGSRALSSWIFWKASDTSLLFGCVLRVRKRKVYNYCWSQHAKHQLHRQQHYFFSVYIMAVVKCCTVQHHQLLPRCVPRPFFSANSRRISHGASPRVSSDVRAKASFF